MNRLLRWPMRLLAYSLFCLLDHGCWLLIQLLPGPQIIDLAQRRPWLGWSHSLTGSQQLLWTGRIRWLLARRCRRAGWGSTCLSRSLSGRLLLDLIGVANELHLGMCKFDDGRRVAHAWLQDPATGRLFTPGLRPGAGSPLTQL